jgi:hypothetical protein
LFGKSGCLFGSFERLFVFGEHCSGSALLEVNPRNFVPAYVTCIETKTEVLSRKHPINVYHRKHEPPQQPRADEPSTVRFDQCWGVSCKASVHAFVQLHGVFSLGLTIT